MFEVPEDVETCLWDCYWKNSYELMKNPEQSLANAGIYSGQVSQQRDSWLVVGITCELHVSLSLDADAGEEEQRGKVG